MVMEPVQEGAVESCRLCGAQEGKLLHLDDTFSILGTSSTILHLLHSISVFLKVQSECEPLMPHHLCWQCFNTAVDINAFIDSGINFQRTTINHILPSHNTRTAEAPCHSLLPVPAPSENAPEVILQGELVQEGEEEREVVLGVSDDQMGGASVMTVTKEETRLEGCYQNIQNNLDKKSEGKTDWEGDGSFQYPSQINQRSVNVEAANVGEFFENKQEEPLENTNCGHEEKVDQHQGSKQLLDEDMKKSGEDNAREKCSYCNKTFQRQSQLKSHLASHSEARPHQCQVCGVAFKHRRNLVEHSHTHSQQPSFICAVCGLTFKQKSNLLKHERTHRRESVPSYRCEVCGNQYSQSSHLKTHIRNAHGNNPGFRCEQCSVVLVRRSSLRRHMATVHASSTRFTCPHCNKGFTNQQNYQGHIRSHTGERPYRCLVCSKAFTTPKALSRHRLVHQGTKTHKCTQCGKAFLELCDLKRHTKRHLQKSAKRAKAAATNGCQPAATGDPADPNVGSINLMVLTDSLIFTESQQLLDNQEPRPDQVILPNGKLDGPKDVTRDAVLQSEPPPLELQKKPNVEVISSGPMLPAASDMEAVLQPPVMGDMAAPLHSGQVLQPTTIEVGDGSSTPQVDLVPRECPGGSVAPDAPTMVVLASASTPTEYLPDPEPRAGARASSPVGDVGERVLSHATW